MSNQRDQEYITKFGNHLRQIRKDNKMSMAKVATHIKTDMNSIYRIEKGRVDISICTLKAIAGVFNISPMALLDFD